MIGDVSRLRQLFASLRLVSTGVPARRVFPTARRFYFSAQSDENLHDVNCAFRPQHQDATFSNIHLRRNDTERCSFYQTPLQPVNWSSTKLSELKKNFYEPHPNVSSRSSADVMAFMKANQITVTGEGNVPEPCMTFEESGLPDYLQKELKSCGYTKPTTIQQISIPIALSGRDLIGISQTGSGKTLAYLGPALVHILGQASRTRSSPTVVILVPTRELALQVCEECSKYARSTDVIVAGVYGGDSRMRQARLLRNGVDVVVACPGRLLDFLLSGTVNLQQTSYFVLDEADRMLDMGFQLPINQIASQIRPDRQTLMYSATWPRTVVKLARNLCRQEPVQLKIGTQMLSANPNIEQRFVSTMSTRTKLSTVCQNVVDVLKDEKAKALVFCNTKITVDEVEAQLRRLKVLPLTLHGGKTHEERVKVLSEYRASLKRVLVATDVAARGIDISDISHVINCDLPLNPADYVHRIGRTGRGGRKGTSITSIDERDNIVLKKQIAEIVKHSGQVFPEELLRS